MQLQDGRILHCSRALIDFPARSFVSLTPPGVCCRIRLQRCRGTTYHPVFCVSIASSRSCPSASRGGVESVSCSKTSHARRQYPLRMYWGTRYEACVWKLTQIVDIPYTRGSRRACAAMSLLLRRGGSQAFDGGVDLGERFRHDECGLLCVCVMIDGYDSRATDAIAHSVSTRSTSTKRVSQDHYREIMAGGSSDAEQLRGLKMRTHLINGNNCCVIQMIRESNLRGDRGEKRRGRRWRRRGEKEGFLLLTEV